MRVLFVSPYIPSPVRVRPYQWISALGRLGHRVHVVALRPPEDAWADDRALRAQVTALEVFPLSRRRTLLNAVRAIPSLGRPIQLAYSTHPAAEARVLALARSGQFDVVHVEHLRGVSLASGASGVARVWDAVDSISALFSQAARLAPARTQRWIARMDLGRTRRFEARAPFTFDRTIVTAPPEADAFAQLAGQAARRRLSVIPNGVDTEYFSLPARSGREAVLFSGKLSYHANAAAAMRLMNDIMPRVWAERPLTKVILAGKDPPEDLRRFADDPRVTVTGYLEDLRPVFAQAAVAIAPLVYGAGIQNKVLEAMACGLPVVASSALASTIAAADGEQWLLGSTDDDLARGVLALLADEDRRDRMGRAARDLVVREHRWDVLAARLVDAYETAREERRHLTARPPCE